MEEAILFDIIRFLNYIKSHPDHNPRWELVSAYNTLTIIDHEDQFDFRATERKLVKWYDSFDRTKSLDRYLWKLPVCYDEEFGMDMEELTGILNLPREAIIDLHTSTVYTIYGIGFLPGFMYLGGLPQALETPRRSQPRLKVPKGSVGLAGKQTGIYPQDSPGGWNIIGNCPISLFNPQRELPCLVNVGDRVQFFEVARAEYEVHKIEAEVDIYSIEKTPIDD